MQLSTAIQAHPSREKLAGALAAQLPGCDLVFDPEPDAPQASAWRTYRLALERTPSEATHRLVIQDDAELCRSFLPTVHKVVEARPDSLVTLFVAGIPRMSVYAIRNACRNDEPFALLPRNLWVPTVALIWPVRLIEPLLAFVDRQTWGLKADDAIVGRYANAHRIEAWATVPSLVEHPDVVESVAGNKRPRAGLNTDRVAACFIADDIDPLTIDWR